VADAEPFYQGFIDMSALKTDEGRICPIGYFTECSKYFQ